MGGTRKLNRGGGGRRTSGLIATDSFVSWFMRSFVRKMPFSVGSIIGDLLKVDH